MMGLGSMVSATGSALASGCSAAFNLLAGPPLSESNTPSAPVRKGPDQYLVRASLTTVIQTALFGWEPEGTKVDFQNNALTFDAPGYQQTASRTFKVAASSVTGSKTGAKKNALPELLPDFRKARYLHASNNYDPEQIKFIKMIFFHAMRGLDGFDDAYKDPLVTVFTEEARGIFKSVYQMPEDSQPSAVETPRKTMEVKQLALYSTAQLQVIADAFETASLAQGDSNPRKEGVKMPSSIELIKSIVESRIFHWGYNDVDAFMSEEFS